MRISDWSSDVCSSDLGSVAPELLVSHWIDGNGQARPPLTLKELGERHRVLLFYQHWCPGCHSHGFPTLLAFIAAEKAAEIGSASVRDRVWQLVLSTVVAASIKRKKAQNMSYI